MVYHPQAGRKIIRWHPTNRRLYGTRSTLLLPNRNVCKMAVVVGGLVVVAGVLAMNVAWLIVGGGETTTTATFAEDPPACSSPDVTLSQVAFATGRKQDHKDPSNKGLLSPPTTASCPWLVNQNQVIESSAPLSLLLLHVKRQIHPLLNASQCRELVVYGVAFGDRHLRDVQKEASAFASNSNSNKSLTHELLQRHGPCFFMFVLEQEGEAINNLTESSGNNDERAAATTPTPTKTMDGLDWMISVPLRLLPYRELRRNAKLFKYLGNKFFGGDTMNRHHSYPRRVIWQDAKFRRGHGKIRNKRPRNYHRVGSTHACVTLMGLPLYVSAVGRPSVLRAHEEERQNTKTSRLSFTLPTFPDHCKHVLNSIRGRPNVTDSPQALRDQCQWYRRQSRSWGSTSWLRSRRFLEARLDAGLTDTAFIVWNNFDEQCRAWNEHLQCAVWKELDCYSDRDQVVWPHVLLQHEQRQELVPLKNNVLTWSNSTPRQWAFANNNNEATMLAVHITQPSRHWYFGNFLEEGEDDGYVLL